MAQVRDGMKKPVSAIVESKGGSVSRRSSYVETSKKDQKAESVHALESGVLKRNESVNGQGAKSEIPQNDRPHSLLVTQKDVRKKSVDYSHERRVSLDHTIDRRKSIDYSYESSKTKSKESNEVDNQQGLMSIVPEENSRASDAINIVRKY